MKRFFISMYWIIIVLLILGSKNRVHSKRILVLVPTPSYSHQIVHRSLCLELNRRGHEVVILTANPVRNATLTNYREIDIHYMYKILKQSSLMRYIKIYRTIPRKVIHDATNELVNIVTNESFEHPEMRKLYAPDSGEKFDLVIVEALLGPALFALAHRFNAPLIGFLTVDLHLYHHFDLGSPLMVSHISQWDRYGSTGSDLPYSTRIRNFIESGIYLYRYYNDVVAVQEKMVKRIFGNNVPHVSALTANMSIMLVNHDIGTSHPRPVQPNTIFFNSLHVLKKPPPLPKDLKNFLDNAANGFIYMSLGSNMKSADMKPEFLKGIIRVFSRLPYRVLWKFESDQLPKTSDNVLTGKWIPQQSVLAHPNIKLFIYQGGLQSTDEAVHYAVPVIGIPLIFDQEYRVGKLESLGAAIRLDPSSLSEQSIGDAIDNILNNASYRIKMKELSDLVKDKPYDNTEHVVWWVEHVMRTKGAPHLKFDGLKLPWYKREDMDIIAILSVTSFLIISLGIMLLVKSILWMLKRIFAVSSNPSKDFSSAEKESKKSK